MPVFVGRGVVQISAYIDSCWRACCRTGAVAAITNAQLLYTLPVSLFGMSVSAAELPAMAGVTGSDEARHSSLRARLDAGLRSIALLRRAVRRWRFSRSATSIAAALLQTGRFTREDAIYIWVILAGSAVGLLRVNAGPAVLRRPTTRSAIRGRRFTFAIVRVALSVVLGYLFAIRLPPLMGVAPAWGVAGLAASGSVAGWVEMLLLRARLNARIGPTGLAIGYTARLWASAALAAGAAWMVKLTIPLSQPIAVGLAVVAIYGVVYFGMTLALRVPEASAALNRLLRRASR